jgi:3-methyladenine DNA glycosylase AlkD
LENTIRKQLFELRDEAYKEFQSKLCPSNDNIIGVRLPILRKLAKQIAKENWREYMEIAEDKYYEEVMLQGMVLGYIKTDIEEVLNYIKSFVPKIDNWSVCDSFCIGLKCTKVNMLRVWNFIQPYVSSYEEFEVRFAIVMLIDFYIEENYIDRILKLLDETKHEGYYVKMALAWAMSICYVKFPKKTMQYLKNNTLDNFTYSKALQKIIESLQVDKETKVLIRSMKCK